MIIRRTPLRLEDGLDTLVTSGAAEEGLPGRGVLAEGVKTDEGRATASHTVDGRDGDIVGSNAHEGIASAKLASIHALPRVRFVVAAAVRPKGTVDVSGEGSHPVIDKLESIPLAEAINNSEVGGTLQDEVEGSLHIHALLPELKGIEANVSEDRDVVGLLEIVLLLGGRKTVGDNRGVASGVAGAAAGASAAATATRRSD